ncbi:hemagglutinin repeat-containing protein [Variovorax sp. J22P168]|uniref:hemagglutinin repeat-containing protein n=1 Tax=Variovorax jilinensis TaxID=3053513 RepID=UPI002578E4A8|nr:hemagglutinin repeat-containing protein [Variovorax sp. J22P168]MDM0014712.1 hemagglutinin repeat-containing protein [Variovorax sp. J22P168]
MNHIYRIVWNTAVQAWIAVAETSRGRGKSSKSIRPAAPLLVAAALAGALGASSAGAQTAVAAPGAQTNVYLAPNGATVVNIANPNAAGLSHNRYQQFNVNAAGLILNNTTTAQIAYSSQLAGQIMANYNTAKSASVILNEVVSNNRSTLAGFTEVLGGRADVVLANPYGITCSSCGFINTDRVTLTTGLPFMRADGSLGGFNVNGGDILVTGNGLNATAQQVLDLVTRSVRIEGKVNAQDLGITTGTNQWDYGTRAVTGSVAAQGTAPAYAIDSAALGGMYANRIRLSATEAGVGVRMLGDAAASAEDFVLSAAGRIELQNRISAQRDVLLASSSKDAVAIALADASLTAARDIAATAREGGLALVRSAVIAGNDLKAVGSRVDAGQGARLQAGGALAVEATAGDMALGGAAVRAQGDLRLTSAGKVSTAVGDGQGVQSIAGQLAIDARGGLANAGVITADRGSVSVRAGERITNTGTVNSGEALDIADATGGASQALDNSGNLLAGQSMTTRAAAIDNSGWMQAGGANTIDAASLRNGGRVLAVTGSAKLNVAGAFDNAGSVRAAQDVVAKAGQLNNSGDLLAARALDLQAGAVTNALGGWVQAATGSKVAADSLANTGTWLLSQQAGASDQVDVGGKLLNAGVMQSAGNAAVSAGELDNRQVIAASGKLDLATTGTLNNGSGAVLQAGQALSVDSGGAIGNAAGGTLAGSTVALRGAEGLDNAGVVTASGGDTTLRVDGAIANSGKIHAAGNLDVADRQGGATQSVDNSGQLLADGAMALKAAAVQNRSGGWVQAASGSSIDAGSIDNQGTWLLSTQAGGSASQVRVAGTLTNRGTLQAQQDAVITAGRIDNRALALLRTGGNLQANVGDVNGLSNAGTLQAGNGQPGNGAVLGISGTGSQVDNAEGGVMLGDKLAIAVAGLSNAGNIQGGGSANSSIAAGGTLTNQAGGVITMATTGTGGGTLSGKGIVNRGTLQSLGGMTLAIGSDGLQSRVDGTAGNGDILAARALTLKALGANSYTATLDGTLQSGGALTVTGDAQSTLALNGTAVGDSVGVNTGNVAIGALGALVSQGDLSLKASTLSLAVQGSGSSAKTGRVLAALSGSGTGVVETTGALTNNGLIFSANDLEVKAPSITVGATGALSALHDLRVQANGGALDLSAGTPAASAGKLNNAGLLYAGNQLTARANGTLTNTGDINSEGSLSLTANTLVNGRIINATNDVDIVAATLRNEIIGLTRIDQRGADSVHDEIDSRDDKKSPGVYEGGNKDVATLYQYDYTVTQRYSQALPDVVPQVTAGRNMRLAFHEGRNTGGTLFAGNQMTLQGFSYDAAQSDRNLHAGLGIADGVHGFRLDGASFTNDNLALTTTKHVVRYSTTTKYIALGPDKDYENRLCDRNGTWDDVCYTSGYEDSPQTPSANNVLRAGLYTAVLRGTGFSLVNNGSTARNVGSNEDLTSVTEGVSTSKAAVRKGDAQGGPALTGTQGLSGPEAAKTGAAFGGATGARPVSGISFLDANAANGVKGTSFGGIDIALPTNPNGLFVTAQEPGAKYLVESNPLYMTGSATMGSDYLSKLLGYNPDQLSMRLGDASYEAWLVKQQVIKQTGSAVLASYQNAGTQMQGLMESAASQVESLGLTYGKALTPQQQAALKQDMVWMVQTEIDGKTVLAPVVYLAQSTKNNIASGAVISAQDANLSLTSLTNTGGTIVGGKALVIASTGDITNLSGTIRGGNVSLSSTEGSIVNKTDSLSGGGEHFYSTVLGKTAGIESTGTLSLDAKKDITNIGATINAGTDASLKAGGNVTFDTLEKKDTTSSFANIAVKNGNGYTSTTTTKVEQVKSGLTVGGNLAVDAGKDITLAGTDAKVGGNADLKAGGDLNIIARENSTTTHTESKSSGLGMNNSLYGTNTTTTDSLSVRNVGSTLQVGGNASLAAKNDITVQGSDVNVAGDGRISATNVNVLAGRNYDESSTTSKSTGVMQVSASGSGKASASASAEASSGRGLASASAQAGAEASGKGAAGLAFSSTTTTQTSSTDLRHVGSNLNFGGNLVVDAAKDVTLQGSTVNAGGNASVNAQNVNLLAAEDKRTSSTSTTTTKVGLMASTDNKVGAKAGASAGAAGGKGTPGANAQAGAELSASTENRLDLFQRSKTTTDTLDTTHQGSAINAKGNLDVKARDTLALEGSTMSSGGNMSLSATDMSFKAVDDVHEVRKSSDTTTAGLYATGNAGATAKASANVGVGAQAGAGAKASASGEVGLYGSNTKSSSVDGSTTAVTSGLSSGGNITRNAGNSITDVGTRIEGGGDLNQSAKTITSLAAADTTYSSSNSTTHTARVGAYAEASAEVSATAAVGPGASKPVKKGADGGAGIRASYQYDNESEKSASSNAVVSTIRMGGSVNSSSSGQTTMEGTQISAAKDVSLSAGSLDYKAAQNTASASANSTSAGATVGVDLVKKDVSVGVSYDGAKSSSSESNAVVGGIAAGGNLTVKTTGDTRFEGTNLSAGGAASVDAGGKVDFAAAKNTASSSSQDVGVDVGITAGKSGASGSAAVGYAQSKSSLNEDVAGSIQSGSGPLTIKSGGDASFTGTKIASEKGDVSVAAGGNLDFSAARKVESSSSLSVDVSAAASGGKKDNVGGTRPAGGGKKTGGETMNERSGEAGLAVGSSKSSSDTATGGSITSGAGAIRLSSGKNTALEGTQVKAANGITADAGGSFTQKDAKSTSSSQTVGFAAAGSGSSLSPVKKATAKAAPSPGNPATPAKPAATPATPAPKTKAGAVPAKPATPAATPAAKPGAAPAGSPATPATPAATPAAAAAKPPVNPNAQQKGSGSLDVYVDNQKRSSSQATTLDGGAGGVVINQGQAGK